MTIFGKLRPSSEESKLIRDLLKRRIEADPAAQRAGFDSATVDNLSVLELQSCTEAMIFTVVETYAGLIGTGVSPKEALSRIEHHRSRLGQVDVHSISDLERYVDARVQVEHRGPALPKGHVGECVAASKRICRLTPTEAAEPTQVAPVGGPTTVVPRQVPQAMLEGTFIIQVCGGTVLVAAVDGLVMSDWADDVEEFSTLAEAMAVIEDVLQAEAQVDEGEPLSEGYLAHVELQRGLNQLRVPGEHED